jgi:predicted DNA-binding protein with PD1-like motif
MICLATPTEIVGLVGHIEYNERSDAVTFHLHISLAGEDGVVWGGHVLSGGGRLPIFTTAEVTLLAQPDCKFTREIYRDEPYGFKELVVRCKAGSE